MTDKGTLRKLITGIFLLTFMAMGAQMPRFGVSEDDEAPAKEPVKWSASVKMTSPEEGILTLVAEPGKGWHLYALELPKGGPKPTVINLDESRDVKFTSSLTPSRKPLNVDDKMFDLRLSYWEGTVTFSRKFRITGKSPVIKAVISFMACDNVNCTPPKKVVLTPAIKK